MKLRYNLPKGRRNKKQTVKTGRVRSRYYYVECKDPAWYCYYEPMNQWYPSKESPENWKGMSGPWICYPTIRVKSVKAFVRLLKKWSKYLPKGIEFELQGRYVDDVVIGKTC